MWPMMGLSTMPTGLLGMMGSAYGNGGNSSDPRQQSSNPFDFISRLTGQQSDQQSDQQGDDNNRQGQQPGQKKNPNQDQISKMGLLGMQMMRPSQMPPPNPPRFVPGRGYA